MIEGDGADEGDVDMAVRREKSNQRQQAAQDQGDPTLDVEQKTYPHRAIAAQPITHLYWQARRGGVPRGHQRILPEPKPGPPAAENTQTSKALTTYSRSNT